MEYRLPFIDIGIDYYLNKTNLEFVLFMMCQEKYIDVIEWLTDEFGENYYIENSVRFYLTDHPKPVIIFKNEEDMLKTKLRFG